MQVFIVLIQKPTFKVGEIWESQNLLFGESIFTNVTRLLSTKRWIPKICGYTKWFSVTLALMSFFFFLLKLILVKKIKIQFIHFNLMFPFVSLHYVIMQKLALKAGKHWNDLPAGIYLLKVNNINTRTKCEICSKST